MTTATKPVLVGIGADACCGKSSFAAGLAAIFGAGRAVVISLDDYRRYTRLERKEARYSRIHPDVYYLDLMAQHLELLRSGQSILRPVYNRTNGVFDRSIYQEPCEFVIAEGLQAFATPELRGLFDLKLFVDPDEGLKTQWKLARDVEVRRRSEADVRAEIKHWRADADAFIAPQRTWADVVLRIQGRSASSKKLEADLISLLLRPTLPRPNLADLFLKPREGIQLNLDRDMGIPIDRLDVPVAGRDSGYLEVETVLWSHIVNKKEEIMRDGVGEVIGPAGERIRVPALKIAQLVVALEMLEAGTGQ